MKKNWKRMLSLLLTVCVIAGLLVLPAAAEDGDEVEPGETITYDITAAETENGTVSFQVGGEGATKAAEGDEVTVVATPGEGFEVGTITTDDEDTTVADGKFTMPAKAVTVTVTFTATEGPDDPPTTTKEITFDVPEGVTVVVKVNDAVTELTEGKLTVNETDTVTFELTVADTHELDSVNGADEADGVYTVTGTTVTITATERTVTPLEPDTFTITVNGGTTNKEEAAAGDSVTVTANAPESGKVFDKWTTDDLTLSDEEAAENPLTFTMPAKAVTLTATYKNEDPTPTVNKNELNAAIKAANDKKAGVEISANGKDIDKDKTWVTREAMDALNEKLTVAEAVANGEDATQTAVDEAKDALEAATTAFTPAAGTKVDKTALDIAIANANNVKTGVEVNTDAGNVAVGIQWVTQGEMDALDAAIIAAQSIKDDTTVDQTAVNDVVIALTGAISTFNDAKKDGEKQTTEVSDLQKLVAAAKTKMNGVVTSADGTDIDKDKTWVTPEVMDNLDKAIQDAETVIAKGEEATADEIAAAAQALKTASDAFVTAGGTKEPEVIKYTVTVTGGTTDKGEAAAGESVTVTANAPDTGKAFDKWTAEGLTLTATDEVKTSLTFSMPGNNVTLTATYKDDQGGEPTVNKKALTDAIAAAEAAAAAIVVDTDAANVAEGTKWILAADKEAYETAIAAAKAVAESGEATQEQVDAAVDALADATTAFEAAQKVGTKDEGGEPFDVVPGNLGQIDENSALPANGLAEGYTATAVKTAEGAVTVALKADTLFKHKNALGTEGFWIGFGMPIEEGKTYTYCVVEDGVDGDPIASVAERVQTVAGKDYNTIYFNLDAEDAGKTQTVIVKQSEGDNAITYTVNITVAEMTDPLTKALAEALQLRTDVQTSTDGTNVSTSDKWVTRDVMDTLDDAYREAKAVADASSDAAERAAAAAKLNAAIATFKAAMRDGTKSGGGGGRPTYGPSGPAASNNTVDKTSETLADGTKRDTETAKDGTVTVTETKPNGTKTVTTTTPDGAITTDVTLGNGVKSATLAIPVKDAGNGTVAVIVKDDGTEEIIRSSKVEDGNVVFELNRDAKVKVVNNAKRFVDIANHWAKDYVDYVTAREFFNGVDATHFSPDTAMTRAMLATVLYRLVGETNVDGTANYKDVAVGTWYTDAVSWASKVGVVNGYPDGTFAPNRAITREELVVMFYRYAGSPQVDDTASLVAYQDADQVSSWAETAMRWAVKNGIINGKSVDTLLPRGNATRAEVSAVLQRYVNLAK